MAQNLSTKNEVSLDSLREIELPQATDTYCPVSHYDLAMNIQKVSNDLLVPKGYVFAQSRCGTAREGQRVFGIFRFTNGADDYGMAIGWRNSYDKSMSAAVAIGANVFVCDNLCIHGDITIMRRHTKNIENDLVQSVVGALYNASGQYQKFHQVVDRLKTIQVNDQEGYRLLGYLAGEGVLKPTPFNIAMRQWKQSDHECFELRTGWSLYNAVTAGLKEVPPHQVFELHRQAHTMISGELIGEE